MKDFILIGLCFISLSGCSLNKNFVKSVKVYTDIILPEYKAYVNNDTTLRDDSKRIRAQTADKFSDLVSEALRENEK